MCVTSRNFRLDVWNFLRKILERFQSEGTGNYYVVQILGGGKYYMFTIKVEALMNVLGPN